MAPSTRARSAAVKSPTKRTPTIQSPRSQTSAFDSGNEDIDMFFGASAVGEKKLGSFRGSTSSQGALTKPDPDMLLEPLKNAAERASREVERFAETLDKVTNHTRKGSKTRQIAALEMVHQHSETAQKSVHRLQEHNKLQVESRTRRQWARILYGIDGESDSDGAHKSLQPSSQDEIDQSSEDTSMETLEEWEEEARTWELLESLLRVQHPEADPKYAKQSKERLQILQEAELYPTNQELWDRFLLEDKAAQEYDIVLSWLKDSAEISGKDIELLLDSIRTYASNSSYVRGSGWLHTKLAIKNQKRLRSWPKPLDPSSPGISESLRTTDGTESLVTQLDPDAPTRQHKTLDPLDATSESIMWLLCWEMVRRGENPEKISDICLEQGEGWRGVLLSNGQSFRKPVSGRQSSHQIEMSSGRVASRSVWRQTCLAAAQNMDAGGDAHERAVYGAMAGDRRSVEKVCKSWNDFLFAHYNALLMAKFDSYVASKQKSHQDSILLRDRLAAMSFAPAHPSASPLTIVDSLRPHLNSYREPLRLIKSLQGALISKNFIALARAYGGKIRYTLSQRQKTSLQSSNSIQDQMDLAFTSQNVRGLRMMAHVLFVFQDLGLDISGEGYEDVQYIIIGYMEYLRDSRRMDMLPIYASRLPNEEGAAVLGRLLVNVASSQERDHQMRLMAKVGIDSSRVVYHLMHDLMDQCIKSEDDSPTVDSINIVINPAKNDESSAKRNGPRLKVDIITEPSIEDMTLVQGYEWYLAIKTDILDDWTEAFAIGTQLYHHFFRHGKLAAAVELLDRVPSEALWNAKSKRILDTPALNGTSRTLERDETSLKTDIMQSQMRLFLEFEHLIVYISHLQVWSNGIESPPKGTDARSSSYQDWKRELTETRDAIVESLRPLISGWLLKGQFDVSTASLRRIRNAYIPDVIMAFVSVMNAAGHILTRDNLLDSLDIYTAIAAENSDLVSCFTETKQTRKLVDAAAYTSRAILRAQDKRPKAKKAANGASLSIWNVKV